MKVSFLLCILLVLFAPGHIESQHIAGSAARAAVLYGQGRNFMANEDWFSALEVLLEGLRHNPAHAEATAALAECYFQLGEYDEALSWVRRARLLARGNTSLANLEASILIALGRLDAAATIISEVLTREPFNREALFVAGELDIAPGRSAQALLRYREAVRRYPDDRRLLVSLALVSGSLGDTDAAISFINRAMAHHSGDHRVFFYAAYIYAQANRLPQALAFSERSLNLRPGYAPARSLLANLRYRNGQFEEAARLADEAIAANRNDLGAWYLKGLSYAQLGRNIEALTVLGNALAIDPNNEFIRAVLEDTLIAATALEDPRRAQWAAWRFYRARNFRSRNLMDQALFEYRRGLRLNPYAAERRGFAELLRLQGFPARHFEEIRFLQDMGMADRSLTDAVEAFDSLLTGALFRRWDINPMELDGRHWNIAVFSVAGQSSSIHADAGAVAASFVREILMHDRAIVPMNLEIRQPSFSQAFRTAREAGADYFMIVSVMENERDISLNAELFVGRTGSPAADFRAFRTGVDRLRNSSRAIVDQLGAALPFRGTLLQRRQSQGLIDKGRADGVTVGAVYDVVIRGRFQIASEGIGILFSPEDHVGTFTVEITDEEVSSGVLSRNGFFDRIEAGDEIILTPRGGRTLPAETAANPELRALLRALR